MAATEIAQHRQSRFSPRPHFRPSQPRSLTYLRPGRHARIRVQSHKGVPRQRSRNVRSVSPGPAVGVIVERDVLNDLSVKRVDLVERSGAVLVQKEAVLHLNAGVSKANDLALAEKA